MKAILMSIRPEWVAKILNGEKTIEIRKRFPKDYVGWVYIYVTQNHKHAGWKNRDTLKRDSHDGKPTNHFQLWTDDMVEDKDKLNGKVVARFWCNKVENISDYLDSFVPNGATVSVPYRLEGQRELLKHSCLTHEELIDYLKESDGYAIHITKVKPFYEPKEISEFWTSNYNKSAMCDNEPQFPCTKCPNTGALYCNCKFLLNGNCSCISLTRAPQNYCYIEV